MMEADYDGPSPTCLRNQRIASIVVLLVMAPYEWSNWSAAGARIVAAQIVATGIIWFCDGELFTPPFRRAVSYRSLGWVALIGLPIFVIFDIYIRSLLWK